MHENPTKYTLVRVILCSQQKTTITQQYSILSISMWYFWNTE